VLSQLKELAKKYPKPYEIIRSIFSPVFLMGKSYRVLQDQLDSKGIVFNLGSGSVRRTGIQNLDCFPYPTVDIVADIHWLPFLNESINGVISEAVLEHVSSPQKCVEEIQRVLKPGGLVYCRVPFVVPFHSAPSDYFRWTKEGIRKLFDGFEILEFGIAGGPTSAFLWVFQEWVAMLFSFNQRWLYELIFFGLMLITFPLKFLDFILSRYSFAVNMTSTFYVLAKKPLRA